MLIYFQIELYRLDTYIVLALNRFPNEMSQNMFGWSCSLPLYAVLIGCLLFTNTAAFVDKHSGRSLHNKLCIMWRVFDDDGHQRGQTSRPVIGAEIQTNCNFEAHLCHCSYLLGFI